VQHLFFQFILHYGLPAMFLLVFIENIGIPLPTEAAYVVAQTLITRGDYSYITVSLILLAGHVGGSVISYFLGRHIGQELKKGKSIEGVQSKLQRWYTRYGIWAIILTRLVGQVRPWSSYVAGSALMSFAPFLAATIVGTIVFNTIALTFTHEIVRLSRIYPFIGVFLTVFFTAGILVIAFIGINELMKRRR
jgi:membrane protein DedA with SNARE-associated domain